MWTGREFDALLAAPRRLLGGPGPRALSDSAELSSADGRAKAGLTVRLPLGAVRYRVENSDGW